MICMQWNLRPYCFNTDDRSTKFLRVIWLVSYIDAQQQCTKTGGLWPFSCSAITTFVVFIFVCSSLLVKINTQLLHRSLQSPPPPGKFWNIESSFFQWNISIFDLHTLILKWYELFLWNWYRQNARVYSIELEIKDTTDRSALYPDLHLKIESEGRLTTKLYDKGFDFKFSIVKLPFICSNIPASCLKAWSCQKHILKNK